MVEALCLVTCVNTYDESDSSFKDGRVERILDSRESCFCVSDPPLLQTNGKLPMWFRKLVSSLFAITVTDRLTGDQSVRPSIFCVCVQQGQGEASAAVQSDAKPRQVRSRWAEQLDPLIICSSFSPSQMEEEEEEEEDFHPQSLDSLLGEEVEEEEDGEEEKEVSSVRLSEVGAQTASVKASAGCGVGGPVGGRLPVQRSQYSDEQMFQVFSHNAS